MEYERACLLSATNANDVSRAQATFLSTVVSKFTTEAFHTLRRYLQSINDVKNLLSLLLKAQRFSDAGIAIGKKSLQTEDFREKQSMLSVCPYSRLKEHCLFLINFPCVLISFSYLPFKKESSRIFGLGKETAFHKTTTDEYIELLKDRKSCLFYGRTTLSFVPGRLTLFLHFPEETLRAKYGSFDVAPGTSSVTVSISAILSYAATTQDQREKMQLLADAEKLARKARISPKRLYHIRVKAYADGGHWTTLTELAESRQTPLGYKPFVRAAIYGYQGNNRDEYILSFIQKLGSNEERFDMLCEAALWKQALKVAEKDLKDIRRVKQMKDRCTDKTLHLEVEEALGRLAT
jgi:vacuolar protein sorting-associated protein 16